MTQYLLSVYQDEASVAEWEAAAAAGDAAEPNPEIDAIFAAVDTFNGQLQDKGAWVFAGGLHPPSTATVVAAHQGEHLVTDGPYAECREQLGGFWVIQAADLDEALAWARDASQACQGAVEVRPFQDDD